MHLDLNSQWKAESVDGLPKAVFRLLATYDKSNLAILFELHEKNTNKLFRPVGIPLSVLEDAIKQKKVVPTAFAIPPYQLTAEADLPMSYRKKRDEQFMLIETLIADPSFLLELATISKSSKLVDQAKKKNVSPIVIHRCLNRFWRYGQKKNALLPAYALSGGLGKRKSANNLKRGRPITTHMASFCLSHGINIDELEKEKLLKGIQKYLLKGEHKSLKSAWRKTIIEFYADEIERADASQSTPQVPSYRQFVYWAKQLIKSDALIQERTSSGDFKRNKRGLRGAATDNANIPGNCFELDATVADVHVVSPWRRNHVIGRPTIYSVVDKASRMIVGLHVSMEYASWRAGRQALVNAFLPKPAYCAQFGIEISESDWPCQHLPQRLLCDRGEFICDQPEKLVVPLMQLCIAPPYRPELKGIVERRFGILNQALLHDLLGTTKGRQYVRGEPDPRQKAIFTLHEVSALLINEVLEHNQSICEALASQTELLIENKLSPTPLNYWNIHRKRYRTALFAADEIEVRARLLPKQEVSITRAGIMLNEDMYYSCDRVDFDSLKTEARNNGRQRVEARIDQDNSSYIYVRFRPNESFTRCELMQRSKLLANMHAADIVYFKDWKKSEKQKAIPTIQSLHRSDMRKQVEENAKLSIENATPLGNKTEKVADIRARRQRAIELERQPFVESKQSPPIVTPHETNKRKKIVKLMKRKKDGQP